MPFEFDTEAFATAYIGANRIAQTQDPTKPDFRCAYEIATELGYVRDSFQWDAAVAGAAAFYINGNRL